MTQAQTRIQQVHIKIDGTDLADPALNQLIEVEVDSGFNMPATAVLRFHDDQLELLGAQTFAVGKQVEISFPKPDSSFVSVFKGLITTLEPEFGEDLRSIFVVRCHDKLLKLHRNRMSQVFLNATDSDAVNTVAGSAGLSCTIDSTSIVHEHLMRQDQSDFEFITAIARRTGFLFRMKGDSFLFKAPGSFSEGEVELKWGSTLREFRPRFSVGGSINKVKVSGWDPKKKEAVAGQATSITTAALAAVGFGNAPAKSQTVWSQEGEAHTADGASQQSLADGIAQAALDRIASTGLTAEGTAFGNAGLMPGGKVKTSNLTTTLNGTYFLTRVRHRYSMDGYYTEFWCGDFGSGTFASLITDEPHATTSFTNQPRGLIRGIVTNNDDPENMARVKVKFPTVDDQLESSWAPVISAGAGKERGFMVLPEVNDEVIVGFVGGDVNYPLVLGGLWNGVDGPPETAVDGGKVEFRELKTREGHILRFTDKSGQEKIEIIDKTAGNSLTIDTANKTVTILADQHIILEAKGDIKLKATNIKLEGSANIDIKGSIFKAEASGNATLKGALAELSASGITKVSGSMVNIN
ncbi:MAG: VgrG-related protein [Dehalococcoidia bacterium]